MTAAASAHPTPPSDSAVPPSGGGVIEDFPAVPLNAPASAPPPRLTVLVPTRDEAATVPLLLARLDPALAELPAEILVVDDSDDDTAVTAARHAGSCRTPVRLLHRPAGFRVGGLGGAVLAGARQARGDWVLVMDADLQHPPEAAARLGRIALRHDVDVVIGTRYAGTGSGGGLGSAGRAVASSSATRLAKTLFPRRLATVTDPLSGLFAFRLGAVDLDRLRPLGFKILLELVVRNPRARVAEVAYEFGPRAAGTSKASPSEGLAFLHHIARLRRDRLIGQLRQRPVSRAERYRQFGRMLSFGAVGLSGVVVNTVTLWFLYRQVGMNHLVGAALATQASTTWNFLLVDGLVYRRRGNGSRRSRAVRFYLMNNLLLLARLPVLQLLVYAGADVLAANAVTLVLLFLLRFLISDRVIYGSAATEPGRDPVRVLVDPKGPAAAATHRRRSHHLAYRYDVAGTVTIGSQIALPELDFFRAQWIPDSDVDISLRVGDIGSPAPRRRAAMTEYADPVTLRYEEHLGRLGANFRIELGEPIRIEVGPLLARSPHVVYTNIVEALLRFVLVSRDRMLLHSACLTLGGVGVMLSALTDTGKTATVLRLLREHGGRFLSDDMTIVDAGGTAVCFPKPLTISAHTLRAVRASDLTPAEWRRLSLQSRLHSKGGRSFALALSRLNVPIMSINALTQIAVPPPKYSVDRLVPCRMGSSTRVRELFVIERGTPRVVDLDPTATVDRMLANTEDAYGFPPFRYLAPAIVVGGRNHRQLRDREREILTGFLGHVRTRIVSSDSYGWADEIPRLLGLHGAVGEPAERPVPTDAEAWPRWAGPRLATPGGLA